MLTNYHTLKALVQKIKPNLEGSVIVEAFTQEKDTLHITLGKGDNLFTIELNATGQGYMFLRQKVERARKNSLDIFPEIWGDEIVDAQIHKADRVIEIFLSSGKKLFLQFFTGKVNFFLTTDKNEVISSFKNPRENIGKRIEYENSESNYKAMVNNFELLKKAWESLNIEDPVRRLVKAVNTIDMLMAREILHRSGDGDIEKIWVCLGEIDKELEDPLPRIYYDGSFPKYFSIIELTHLNLKKVEFEDINEAIRKFVIETKINKSFYDEKKSILDKLKHLLNKAERTVEKIKEEIATNQRAEMYEIYGSILMANLNALHKGMEEVELLNIFSEGGEKIKIKLDPSLSPVENAERYFEKAKRTKASLKYAAMLPACSIAFLLGCLLPVFKTTCAPRTPRAWNHISSLSANFKVNKSLLFASFPTHTSKPPSTINLLNLSPIFSATLSFMIPNILRSAKLSILNFFKSSKLSVSSSLLINSFNFSMLTSNLSNLSLAILSDAFVLFAFSKYLSAFSTGDNEGSSLIFIFSPPSE